jgi:hypothetical protein
VGAVRQAALVAVVARRFLAPSLGAVLVVPPADLDRRLLLTSMVSLAMAVITVPAALVFSHRQLSSWCTTLPRFLFCADSDAEAFFRRELRFFHGTRSMYVFGLTMACGVAALTYESVGPVLMENLHISENVRRYQAFVVFISDFFAGIGTYALFCVSVGVWRLGSIPTCRVRPDQHEFGVLSAGNVLFKVWAAAAGVWFFYVLSIGAALESSVPRELVVTSSVVTLTAVPTTLFILAAFVICQVPLHQRMLESKRREILRLQALLDQLVPLSADAITDDFMRKRQFVEEQLKAAQQLPEWPFTRRAILGTAITAALSTVPTVFATELVKQVVEHAMPKLGS